MATLANAEMPAKTNAPAMAFATMGNVLVTLPGLETIVRSLSSARAKLWILSITAPWHVRDMVAVSAAVAIADQVGWAKTVQRQCHVLKDAVSMGNAKEVCAFANLDGLVETAPNK
jgi:hypothetical protein